MLQIYWFGAKDDAPEKSQFINSTCTKMSPYFVKYEYKKISIDTLILKSPQPRMRD